MRESCVIYENYISAIRALPEEYQLNMYEIIFDYIFKDKEPDRKNGVEYALFLSMKTNIDNSKKRYDSQIENGKKGGRPRKNQDLEEQINDLSITQPKPKITQLKPNTNLNDNDNDNDNVNDNVNDITPLSNKLDIPPKCENTLKKSTKSKKDLENDPLFLKFWEAYPKKVNRPTAVKAYGKIKPMSYEVMDKILFGIERYKNSGLWSDKQFIPYPATFLNNRKWEDEVENLSVGVNRERKPSYDIDEQRRYCQNTLMQSRSSGTFLETLKEEYKKPDYVEVEVT